MKKLFKLALASALAVSVSSCEYINEKILEISVKGIYRNSEGKTMEFTDSKVIIDDKLTFNYKIEDKYVFVENTLSGTGGILFMSDFRFEIVDRYTIKLPGSGGEEELVYKKID